MSILSENLRQLRKDKQKTQTELGNLLKVEKYVISNWETGRTEPSIDWLIKLAGALEVSVDYLLGREDDFGNIVVTSSNKSELSDNERKLLSSFRKLDKRRQTQLVDDAEYYASKVEKKDTQF